MRQHLATLTPVLLGGCSLIYNPNNIEKPPADASDANSVDGMQMVDARIDAPALADANPAALTVLDASPTVIFEGQGVDNSAPAILVISGHHFIPGATVQISPATDLNVGTPTVSTNGDFIAVPITATINSGVNTGTVPLTVTINESGATPQNLTGKVSLTYLPQLTGTTLTLPLAERYSQVAFGAAPTIAGDLSNPVLIRSMSSITCGSGNGAFNAKGAAPSSTSAAGAAGPGGCAGGGQGAAGGCAGVMGGGGAGGAGNGGGGGGYGTAGTAGGGGANGGTLGVAHGSPMILSYNGTQADGSDRNQASGGGGGSTDGINLGNGGGGGGGGGTVEMTAGGDIKCGAINVSGGNGATGTVAVTGGSGGGGGGAGGVVVLRTDRGSISNVSFVISGGTPGGGGGTGTSGGNGGFGRVRVDTAGPPTSTPAGGLHRGLAFALSTMPIYTVDNPMVTLLGTPGDVFDMYVVDFAGNVHTGEPQNQAIDATGMKTMQVTLLAGYNRLCATLRPGMRNKDDRFSLADTCIEIALLP